MGYICTGVHFRDGVLYKVGDLIVPTKYELVQFGDKFKYVADTVKADTGTADTELDRLNQRLREIIDGSGYDSATKSKARKYLGDKVQSKDNAAEQISGFLEGL
jgi:hypothetical protein